MREVLLSHASKSDFESLEQTVAVIGIGCILPGNVNSPSELEELLLARRTCVVDVPPDRWEIDKYSNPNRSTPGKLYVTAAGFLKRDVFEFDPEPFAISPREADRLDPQQRLLLETTWNTLEDAGVPISSVRGTRTAVFVGGFSLDAQSIAQSEANHHLVDSHTAAGGSMTMLSNRLSHVFDLRGPSITIDTACSSSLVAVHLARQAILHDGCPMAIAGGVNVMLSPNPMLTMCKGQFLAPDGRSKAFDASANGYGRGEGAAVVLLKRLDLALADNNRIYAVIRASGVNQDGHTDGISLPSGDAQQSLARSVLTASGLRPTDVRYIEAHGTGTRVGDPIEARALGAVYGVGRQHPVVVGSIKTNFGHLEAAAGITGFIKATLTVCHRRILPQLGPEQLNPDIPLEQLNLRIANDVEKIGEGAAVAAVNSFGYGGTNAHVIVGEWQPHDLSSKTETKHERTHSSRVVPISAMNPAALGQSAAALAKTITDAAWEDQVYSLARTREHLPERAVIIAGSAAQLRAELVKLAEGIDSDTCIRSRVDDSSQVTWVFTGMGPQWWAMGRELLQTEPVFAQTIRELDGMFLRLSGWSPLDELLRDERHSRIGANDVAQITNFLIQAGLTELLRAYGVPMHAALGHSAGEVAAAMAAGCLSKQEAVSVIYHRSRLQQRAAGHGTMLAVGAGAERIHPLIECETDVAIAAYNSGSSLTLAGNRDALSRVAARLEQEKIFNRFVAVEVAYHSPHMHPFERELKDSLRDLRPSAPTVQLYSTMLGALVDAPIHDADYWWRNTRHPVLLERALSAAMADGHRTFIEIGPHPVLSAAIREVLSQRQSRGAIHYCMKRGLPETVTLLRAIAGLHGSGAALDWSKIYPEGRLVTLPNYAFQRERHWVESASSRESRLGRPNAQPLIAKRDPGPTPRFSTDLSRPSLSYLNDYRVNGASVVPCSVFAEAALCACAEIYGTSQTFALEGLEMLSPLGLRPDDTNELTTDVDTLQKIMTFYSRHGENPWERNARVHFSEALREDSNTSVSGARVSLDDLLLDHPNSVSTEEFWRACESRGLGIGVAFQRLSEIRLGNNAEHDDSSFVAQVAPKGVGVSSLSCVDPTLLEASFQGLVSLMSESDHLWLPRAIERLQWNRSPRHARWVHGRIRKQQSRSFTADLRILDDDGAVLVGVQGILFRQQHNASSGSDHMHSDWLYRSSWQKKPCSTAIAEPLRHVIRFDGATRLLGEKNPKGATDLATQYDLSQIPRGATCVYAFASDPSDPYGITACNRLREACAAAVAAESISFVILTQGAQCVLERDVVDPVQAALWGLARVMMTEYPQLNCRLVDLPRSGCDPSLSLDVLLDSDTEEEVSWRNGERYVHRVVRIQESSEVHALNDTPSWGAPVREDRTYLITGGLSGFGLATARWLVERGAQSIVLASRRGQPDAGDVEAVEQLSRRARITTMVLDVTDTQSIDRGLAFIETHLPPLAGVFHAAMQLEDMPLSELTEASLTRTMQVKAGGAWELHQRTLRYQLEHFVLYSSVAALVGNPHQASYAAANAYLNGLAEMRKAHGQVACSVNWGAIGDAGAVARDPATLRYVRSLGFDAMPASNALATLEHAPADSPAVLAIVDVDWQRWKSANPLARWSRLELVSESGSIRADSSTALGTGLKGQNGPESLASAKDRVSTIVAGILGLSRERLSPESPLRQHGLDSLMAVEIQSAIERYSRVSIPVMEILGGASIASLSHTVADRLAEQAKPVACESEPAPVAGGVVQVAGEVDLTQEFLNRICVQPPYFDLQALRIDGEWVHAAVELLVTDGEHAVDVGDAARHLAILGSCAASLRCPIPGKVYYPIARAHYRALKDEVHASSQGRRFALKARCTQFDSSASRAQAVAVLLDAEGQEIAELQTDYHVIAAPQFHSLFAAHAQPTVENRDSGYYTTKPTIPTVRYLDGVAVVRLPPIEPEACLGHFANYPAWPVSLMTRTAIELIAAASRLALAAESVQLTIMSGTVTTHALVFAHQTVSMVARPVSSDLTSWICDVRTGGKVAARFEFETDVQVGDAAISRPQASVVRVDPQRSDRVRKRA